ncbi:MAG: hypothetical protein ABEI57_00260 [Halapricum sp.]
MSDDNHDSPDDSRGVTRRRMLQTVGAGIGLAAVPSVETEAATADEGCARGPFERTYESGTVTVGQIRAEQAHGTLPPSTGAASPGSDAAADAGERSPQLVAQESNVDAAGPLTIRTEYDGVNSLETSGGVPSDSQIAAGRGHLIHALNTDIAIYGKQSGRREQLFDLAQLWDPVIPEPEGGFVYGRPFVFDPRARYDRKADRFVLAAVQYEPGLTTDGEVIDREALEEAVQEDGELDAQIARPPRGWFLVAVSATGNPNGEWHVYRVPPEDAGGVDNIGLVDYPTLGFDEDAVYLTQNFFGATHFEVTMVTLDKAAMYAGETVTAHHFDRMNDPDSDGQTFTVHPAQQPYSGGSDGTFYLANSDFPVPFPGPSRTLTLWELTDPISDPSLDCFTLDVDPYYYPPAARQPETNSLVDTLGTRLMNVDFDDGSVWTAHSTAVDWNGSGRPVAAVRWYEIDASSHEVVQSGTYGEPGTSYFMPTVGANDGTAVIAHNVSGPETFPRMDVAGRTADYTSGKLEDGLVVESGKSKYNALAGPVERWGDYNGVSVDPTSGRFWTVSQYSPDINIPVEEDERDPYATRIAEVYFEDES